MPVTQQQLSYLKAMGIPVWVSRDIADPAIFEDKIATNTLKASTQPHTSQQKTAENKVTQQDTHRPPKTHISAPPAYSTKQLFDEIEQTTPVALPYNASSIADSLKAIHTPQLTTNCSNFNWQQLQTAVIACQQCELYNKRSQVVFGEGEKKATWMIIGDAPKEEEDTQGKPFMDRSGTLLDNMLTAIGLERPAVYLTNTLKCRPPNNRDPKRAESKACYSYLKRQIELVDPALILIVGRIAAQHLLQTKEPLARLRGRRHTIPELDIPVVVTYHPAYLLRQPRDKYKSWQDLKLALTLLKALQ